MTSCRPSSKDFADSRWGACSRVPWELASAGKLVCDDYSGYKALFDRGVIDDWPYGLRLPEIGDLLTQIIGATSLKRV